MYSSKFKKWNPLLLKKNLNQICLAEMSIYTDVVLCIALEGTWIHKLQ